MSRLATIWFGFIGRTILGSVILVTCAITIAQYPHRDRLLLYAICKRTVLILFLYAKPEALFLCLFLAYIYWLVRRD